MYTNKVDAEGEGDEFDDTEVTGLSAMQEAT